MKTYNIDSLNRLKKYSRNFVLNTFFVNKTWQIFDDENNKIFIYFKDDGNVFFSTNGNNTGGTWNYNSSTTAITIALGGEQIVTVPSYNDDNIVALNINNSGNCLILIDPNNKLNLAPTNVMMMESYCDYALKHIDPIIMNAIKAENQKKSEATKHKVEEIAKTCDNYPLKKYSIIAGSILFLVLCYGFYYFFSKPYYKELGISLMIIPFVLGAILWGFFDTQRWQTAIKNMVLHFRDNDEHEITEQMKADKELKKWFIDNYDFDPTRIKTQVTPYDMQ